MRRDIGRGPVFPTAGIGHRHLFVAATLGDAVSKNRVAELTLPHGKPGAAWPEHPSLFGRRHVVLAATGWPGPDAASALPSAAVPAMFDGGSV